MQTLIQKLKILKKKYRNKIFHWKYQDIWHKLFAKIRNKKINNKKLKNRVILLILQLISEDKILKMKR